MATHARLLEIADRIEARSADLRPRYRDQIEAALARGPLRHAKSCGNIAHGMAACSLTEKERYRGDAPNIAIVTSYNDVLSAHTPFAEFPPILKKAIAAGGGIAQVAGGVPAMCDGVTQGAVGMELSLFSRDVIALATAVSMSHDLFDGALYLGVCDKIVPGLFIAALRFGHLPSLFVPAGPMPSGLPNEEKARIRKLYAQGKIDRAALLASESASYHSPGTCTFYGTANSNQVMMEVMGLHVPGTAFINPGTPLRQALTEHAAAHVLALARQPAESRAVPGRFITAGSFVNAIAALHATGGSTNHTMHLLAMAAAAGYRLDWQDFHDLSDVVPLLARVYPNGLADVNQFQQAGGPGFVFRELLSAGLLIGSVETAFGPLARYTEIPQIDNQGGLSWAPAPETSGDEKILRPVTRPFTADGGLKVLEGSLGRAVIKISAVDPARWVVEAPARVYDTPDAFLEEFQANRITEDCVVVIRFQGPRANGMPELHALTPALTVLQDRGLKVALVSDGRMSGASGKVPAAIHVVPEAMAGGPLARIRSGDPVRVDAVAGRLEVLVDPDHLAGRSPVQVQPAQAGVGRELFAGFRAMATPADQGAGIWAALTAA